MKLIIPWDIFFWFASPIDFDNLWKKFDHKKNFEEWFTYHIKESPRGYLLYREHVTFTEKENGYERSYFTFLVDCGEKQYCEQMINDEREYFLSNPKRMYQCVGLI